MKHIEERFVAEYIKNGNNCTKAYLAIKPNVSPNSAAVSAHRLLQKTSVMNALQDMTDKSKEEAIASKQYLINEAHEIGKEARSKGVYGSALKAVEVKGKLNRVYEDGDHVAEQNFNNFVAFINGNIRPEEYGKTKDITPIYPCVVRLFFTSSTSGTLPDETTFPSITKAGVSITPSFPISLTSVT
jgi:hypothetical protein